MARAADRGARGAAPPRHEGRDRQHQHSALRRDGFPGGIETEHRQPCRARDRIIRDQELFLDLLELIQAPNAKVCLDVGHLSAFGGGNFPLWLKTLGPVIGQLHLHDNHGADDDHLALGAGNIPLKDILHYLAAQGPPPIITLEPHQEGSLRPSLEYLARIWPWG